MTRMAGLLVFAAVATAINVGIHYFLWARLVRDTRLPAPWYGLATAAVVMLALLAPVTMFISRLVSTDAVKLLAWPTFVWMGVMFLAFLALLVVDAGKAVALLAGRALLKQDLLADPERRQMLARATAAAAATVSTAMGVAALRRVQQGAHVREVQVHLARLPPQMDGLTLAQLSDIHVGPTIGREFVEQLVHQTNAFKPDLIAVTGDLVDGSVEELGHAVAPFAGLHSRLGTFFVTGNHEYYSGVEQWLAYARMELGWRVLRNQRVEIEQDGAVLDLAGVDDFSSTRFGGGHGPDLAKALAGRDPTRELVLLAHQPREVPNAASAQVGLQLSGHTHGGQIWPWNFAVRLQAPWVEGLYNIEAGTTPGVTQLYVSPGTGYWGPPMRLGTRCEITRVILRSQQRTA